MTSLSITPENTWAVLIGCGEFKDSGWPSIPAAKENLRKLWLLLNNPQIIEIPSTQIIFIDENQPDIIQRIALKLPKRLETLFVYYAGHGLFDEQQQLYLAKHDTLRDRPNTALRFADLWEETVDKHGATNLIYVLDCCYSGKALNTVRKVVGKNISVLTATLPNDEAKAPTDKQLTAFTECLIELLEKGVGNEPTLTTTEIHNALAERLPSKGFPRPYGQDFLVDNKPLRIAYNRAILANVNKNWLLAVMSFVKRNWLTTVGIIVVLAVAVVIVVWLLNGNSPGGSNNHPPPESHDILEPLKRRAEQGDLNAQTRLGVAYYQGKDGAPTNYEIAFNWFDQAAKKGYAEAQYHLSWMYAKGQSVSRDEKKSFNLLTESAIGGYWEALCWLGRVYDGGLLGVPQDQKLSLKWLKRCAEKVGEATITNKISLSASTTNTEWLGKVAKKGNADAQFILGVLNETGTGGVQKNLAEARQWFQKAAAQGHQAAEAAMK